ncbi:MAG: bifunctional molybdopterin-guanine dinucleotide biosynthesis adaptor protein MobB/molybdopterin molybdotransferase MoeA [Thiolinea sp.]
MSNNDNNLSGPLHTDNITGVILAGGQGRRMGGQDKGLMILNGRPLVEYLLNSLRSQTGQRMINANRNIEHYQRYGVPVVEDQVGNYQGPLAGFSTAMQHAQTGWIMTVPCDAPKIAPDMLQRLISALQRDEADIAVAHDGQRLQPVHALLPVRLLPSLQAFMENGGRKIDIWYAQHKIALADFSDVAGVFRNINTPAQKLAMEKRPGTPPIVGICAYSGTGKTTLMAQIIPLLKREGLQLTVIKHGHHSIELDKPGKDSYRFREAGADQVILAASTRVAIMQECHTQKEPSLQETLKLVNNDCADLILVEGFKHENYPKIEAYRPSLNKPLLFPDDPGIIAVASDEPLDLPAGIRNIPRLDLNQPETVSRFIMENILNKQQPAATATGDTEISTEIKTAASCADASDPDSLSMTEARRRLMDAVTALQASCKRPLRDTLDKVLAEDIVSPLNVPAHTNSAMDGYALASADLPTDHPQEYRIIGTALAGQPFNGICHPGECVRIMTGAIMPDGTDCVVMQEHSELLTDIRIRIGTGHKPGQNVRQAGEDIMAGQSVLHRGRRVTPADMGLMASLGIAETKVYRAPRVAFFSTGDELRSIGEPLERGCIYDSNRYTLYSLLTQLGMDIIDMGVVPDQPELMEAAFREASANADVVITSGGVSVGEADYIKDILDKLGEINFWKIAIKPGRPLTFGKLGDALFFGLPGNPVAVMVTFQLFVQPALLKLSGETRYEPLQINAVCKDKLRKKPGRAEFIRAIYSRNEDGTLGVEKAGHQGSGILTSMSRANCFILLPEDNTGVMPGDTVTIQPLGRF